MTISKADLRNASLLADAAYMGSDELVAHLSGTGWWALGSEPIVAGPFLGHELSAPAGLWFPWATYFGELGDTTNFLFDNQNVQAFVAINELDNSLAIAFRGSSTVSDLIQDIGHGLTSFRSEYNQFEFLISSLEQYIAVNGINKVLVTGHSLGGVMAQWFMHDHSEGDGIEYVGITFGSPDDSDLVGIDDPRLVNFGHSEDPVVNSGQGWVSGGGDVNTDVTFATGYLQELSGIVLFGVDFLISGDLSEHDMALLYSTTAETIALSPGLEIFVNDPGQYKVMIGKGSTADALFGTDGVDDFVLGRGGADQLYGFSGDDVLDGDYDNDLFRGGAGNDKIYGGDGFGDTSIYTYTFDHYQINRLGNKVTVGGQFAIGLAADGSDTLYDVEWLQFADGKVSVFDPRINDLGAATSPGSDGTDGGISPIDGPSGNETAASGVFGETIVGTDQADHLHGTRGADVLRGNGGDDVLTGYAGQDSFDGGLGSDTVDYSYQPASVSGTVDLAADSATYPGFYTEALIGIENVWMGAGNDVVYGDDGPNDLRGGPGNDVLRGGLGNDVIYGDWRYSDQGGNDTAILSYNYGSGYTVYGSAANALRIVGAEGIDSYVNVENFQFTDGTVRSASQLLSDSAGDTSARLIERVSVNDTGVQGNSFPSFWPAISGDGRFVAFSSYATNLVDGDTNGVSDIFVFDRQSDSIERISVRSDGSQSDWHSEFVAISADGRYVTFQSHASNLGGPNTGDNTYLHDRLTGVTEFLSVGNSMSAGYAGSPSLSADGRFVAYGGDADILVYDRITGSRELVSGGDLPRSGTGQAYYPSISSDGRYVAFGSNTALVAADTNNASDIYVFDRTSQRTALISDPAGVPINGDVSISGDGRYIAYGVGTKILVYDQTTGSVESITATGAHPNSFYQLPKISGDGRYVAFEVYQGFGTSVAVFDRATGVSTWASERDSGATSIGEGPAISVDGRYVVYTSGDILVSDDTNGVSDVYVHDRLGNHRPLVRDDGFGVDSTDIIAGNVITNSNGSDIDVDGDAIRITAINSQAFSGGTTITLTSGARVTINTDGRFIYDTNEAFDNGPPPGTFVFGLHIRDKFTYTVSDQYGNSSEGTVSVAVREVVRGLHITNASGNLIGTVASDEIIGGLGNEWIQGREGADSLGGGPGNDLLDGWTGDDVLFGDDGNDVLVGSSGLDWLDGGLGIDTASFYGGRDRYVVQVLSNGDLEIADVVTDAGTDIVRNVEKFSFEGAYYSFDGLFGVDDYGNTISTTGTISVGGSNTGNIERTGDADWFAVTLVSGRTYRFQLEGSDTGQGTLESPILRLYGPDGAFLLYDTVSGGDGGPGAGYSSRIIFTAATSGAFYVAADSFSGPFPGAIGTYRVGATDLTPTNAAPLAQSATHSSNEDNDITGSAVATDADNVPPGGLAYALGTGPANGALDFNPDGTFTYTPNANFFGNDSFTFTASDGFEQSNTGTISLQVAEINDEPSFVAGANLAVNEDAGTQTVTGWASGFSAGPANEHASQAIDSFVVSNNNNALFTGQPRVAPDGTLTYTPAANASGIATVTVQVKDNGGTANGGDDLSQAQTFTIMVTPQNDPPIITSNGGGIAANIDLPENEIAVTTVSATDADGPSLTFAITGGADAASFQINASTGVLSFVAAPNFEAPTDSDANNSYIVQVRAFDGSLFDTQTITVNVNDSNEAAGNDFNADGNSDILWRHAGGQVAEWQMNGAQIAANLAIAAPGNEWRFQDTGDFGGDGISDVMWRHSTGQVVFWQMNGNQIVSNTSVLNVSNQYHVQGVGDFGGDGRSDVLFRHESGQVVLWQMNGDQIASNTAVTTVSREYHIAGVGDFGGNGTSDVLWRHDSGQVVLWQMNGDHVVSNTAMAIVSNQYQITGVGDFNGDGRSDVLWRHDSGQVVLWQMNGDQIISNTAIVDVSNEYHIEDVRDFNGDGMSDVLWRHDSGQVVLWQMNGDKIASNIAIVTVANDWTIQAHHFDLI